MKSNIFIPKRINVGYQNRSGTYTGKLAYIIYYDENGVLRKERSWNGWRDEDIPNDEFDNEPTEGFVLNKKAGDYSTGWDHRQAYCRVYDPRGFEFEITIENLLYILANANCYKGKGLEGEFVYGWSGKDLVLIPVESPDYKQIVEFNKIVHNNECIRTKDLIIGATYLTKDDEQWTYMGRFETYGSGYVWKENGEIHRSKNYRDIPQKTESYYSHKIEHNYIYNFPYGKMHWFAITNKDEYRYEQVKSVPKNKFIACIDDKCTEKYSEIFEKMEGNPSYSPYDESKDEYMHYTFDEFKSRIKSEDWWRHYFISKCNDGNMKTFRVNERDGLFIVSCGITEATDIFPYTSEITKNYITKNYRYPFKDIETRKMIPVTLEEIYRKMKPMYLQKYLTNGREYKRVGRLDE